MGIFSKKKPIQIPIYIEVGGEQMNHHDLRIVAAFAKFDKHLSENLGEPIGLATVVATAKLQSDIMDAIFEKEKENK